MQAIEPLHLEAAICQPFYDDDNDDEIMMLCHSFMTDCTSSFPTVPDEWEPLPIGYSIDYSSLLPTLSSTVDMDSMIHDTMSEQEFEPLPIDYSWSYSSSSCGALGVMMQQEADIMSPNVIDLLPQQPPADHHSISYFQKPPPTRIEQESFMLLKSRDDSFETPAQLSGLNTMLPLNAPHQHPVTADAPTLQHSIPMQPETEKSPILLWTAIVFPLITMNPLANATATQKAIPIAPRPANCDAVSHEAMPHTNIALQRTVNAFGRQQLKPFGLLQLEEVELLSRHNAREYAILLGLKRPNILAHLIALLVAKWSELRLSNNAGI